MAGIHFGACGCISRKRGLRPLGSGQGEDTLSQLCSDIISPRARHRRAMETNEAKGHPCQRSPLPEVTAGSDHIPHHMVFSEINVSGVDPSEKGRPRLLGLSPLGWQFPQLPRP